SRCRISSPGAYSLCSANSTLCPRWGLLCSPLSTPSTTARARNLTLASRARLSEVSKSTLQRASRLHDAEQLMDQFGRGNTYRFGVEARQHPVAQHRARQRLDVVHRGDVATVEHRPGLCRNHQVLTGARARPPGNALLDEFRNVGLLGPSVPNQA